MGGRNESEVELLRVSYIAQPAHRFSLGEMPDAMPSIPVITCVNVPHLAFTANGTYVVDIALRAARWLCFCFDLVGGLYNMQSTLDKRYDAVMRYQWKTDEERY